MSHGQTKDIVQAWQTLAAMKALSNQKLKGIAKSSLYEAYLAGWLVFEN
jgi:50S ribosomal protein L16 3-hydroxylase